MNVLISKMNKKTKKTKLIVNTRQPFAMCAHKCVNFTFRCLSIAEQGTWNRQFQHWIAVISTGMRYTWPSVSAFSVTIDWLSPLSINGAAIEDRWCSVCVFVCVWNSTTHLSSVTSHCTDNYLIPQLAKECRKLFKNE